MSLGFTFNGIHSSSFGLVVKTLTPPLPPKPRYTEIKVIGKNGAYRFLDGYEDTLIEVEAVIVGDLFTRRTVMRNIETWLVGQHILTLDYDPLISYNVVMTDLSGSDFNTNFEKIKITFVGQKGA